MEEYMRKYVAIALLLGAAFPAFASIPESYDVKIWDTYPIKESPQIWEKIPPILKEASWIWPFPSNYLDIVNSYALFRETFDLSSVPEKAIMYITADQKYRLYVNGKYICNGPARGFQKSWPYDEVDIAPYLKKAKTQ